MQITTYIHFDGNCEEAIDFYKKAVGARTKALMHFSDGPQPKPGEQIPGGQMPPGDKVMHSEIQFGDTVVFMSDCGKPMQGVSLTYSVKDPSEAEKIFKALGEGGKIGQPLTKTFFSPAFGQLTDRFGVNWIVIVPQENAQQQKSHDKDLVGTR